MDVKNSVTTAIWTDMIVRNASIPEPFLIITFKARTMSLSSLSSCFDIVPTEGTPLDFQEAPVAYFAPPASGITPMRPFTISGSRVAYLASATGFIHTGQEYL